jgi:hypothetical protein
VNDPYHETLSAAVNAVRACRWLLSAGYAAHVYMSFEAIEPWIERIEDTNAIGRVILFLPGSIGC